MLNNSKPKRHKQSKYFTIMLIPYSSNKTRKLMIPHWVLHAAYSAIAVLALTAGIFWLTTNHLQTVANKMNSELEESMEINSQLREESKSLYTRLMNELSKKQVDVSEIIREITGEVDEKIKYYEEMTENIENKIDELESSKDEIYNKISSIDYVPAITVSSYDISAEEAFVTLTDSTNKYSFDSDMLRLMKKYDSLSTRLESLSAVYVELSGEVDKVKPYLDNYPTIWPVKGKVTSEVGSRQKALGGSGSEYHTGIDIAVATGADVKATGGGKVTFAGWRNGYGNLVVISHGFGLETYYAHNSKLLINAGDMVKRGDIIAKSGSTGNSTGPHVHYEVILDGEHVNPRNYIY